MGRSGNSIQNDNRAKAFINTRQDILTIQYVNQMHPELKEIKDQKYYIEFLLQESYVHLGDIYRYTASADAPKLRSTYLGQALIYYKEASNIDKSKGQPC